MAAALVVLAGCGGGGGGGQTTTEVTSQATSRTLSASIGSISSVTSTVQRVTTTSTSSNEQQSGDEVPISTQALFTGKGGRITPGKIEVPPFIAITVVLRSADGKSYGVSLPNRGVITNGRAQLKLRGLRAGDRYVLTTKGGTPAKLIIEANAEPGP